MGSERAAVRSSCGSTGPAELLGAIRWIRGCPAPSHWIDPEGLKSAGGILWGADPQYSQTALSPLRDLHPAALALIPLCQPPRRVRAGFVRLHLTKHRFGGCRAHLIEVAVPGTVHYGQSPARPRLRGLRGTTVLPPGIVVTVDPSVLFVPLSTPSCSLRPIKQARR